MEAADPIAVQHLVEALHLWAGDSDSRLRCYARRAIANLVASGLGAVE